MSYSTGILKSGLRIDIIFGHRGALTEILCSFQYSQYVPGVLPLPDGYARKKIHVSKFEEMNPSLFKFPTHAENYQKQLSSKAELFCPRNGHFHVRAKV